MSVPKVLLVQLSADASKVDAKARDLEAAGRVVTVYRGDYAYDDDSVMDGRAVIEPLDAISDQAVLNLFVNILQFLRRLPTIVLSGGKRFGDFSCGGMAVTTTWDKLMFYDGFIRARFAYCLRAAVLKERPDEYLVVYDKWPHPWQISLALAIFSKVAPNATLLETVCASVANQPAGDISALDGAPRIISSWGFQEISIEADDSSTVTEHFDSVRLDGAQRYLWRSPVTLDGGRAFRLAVQVLVNSDRAGPVLFGVEGLSLRQAVYVSGSEVWFESAPQKRISVTRAFRYMELVVSANSATLIINGMTVLSSPTAFDATSFDVFWGHVGTAPESTGRGVTISTWRLVRLECVSSNYATNFMLDAPVQSCPSRPRLTNDDFEGHAVVLLRGALGSRWFFSPKEQEWQLHDEYIGGLLPAAVERFQSMGWRMSIIYIGQQPDFSMCRPSYTDRYPEFVREYLLSDFDIELSAHRDRRKALSAQLADHLECLDRSGGALQPGFEIDGCELYESVAEKLDSYVKSFPVSNAIRFEQAHKAMQTLSPDLVFGAHSALHPAVCRAAKSVGAQVVSSLLFVGMEMLNDAVQWNSEGLPSTIEMPHKMIAWGEGQRRLIQAYIPDHPVPCEVSGRLRNDTFVVERSFVDTDSVRRNLGLGANDKVILFGATSKTRMGIHIDAQEGACCLSPRTFRESLTALIELSHVRPDVKLIIKPHPSEHYGTILNILNAYPANGAIFVTGEMPYHNVELLSVTDVFVSSMSTMFVEALLMEVPSVYLQAPEVGHLYDPIRTKEVFAPLAEVVHNCDQMKERVLELVDNEAQARQSVRAGLQSLPEYFGSNDGRNIDRFLDMAIAIVG